MAPTHPARVRPHPSLSAPIPRNGCRFPRAAATALALVGGLLLGPPAWGQRQLRYGFSPGMHCEYTQRLVTIDGPQRDVRATQRHALRLWCLAREGHESLLLIDFSVAEADGAAFAGLLWVGVDGRLRVPRGATTWIPALESALEAVPPLPLPVEDERTWFSPPDLFWRRVQAESHGPDPGTGGRILVTFERHEASGIDTMLGQTHRGRFWFDPQLGCVARLELTQTDAGADRAHHTEMTLVEHGVYPTPWAERRMPEVEAWLRAQLLEEQLLRAVVLQPDALERTLRELDRLWSAFQSDLDSRADTPFPRLADDRRRALRDWTPVLQKRAALGARWADREARPWSLQNPAGALVTSEAWRDRVVIECYWSAESVWGLRVLPQMRALQEELPRQGVQILCFNLDADYARARTAIATCGDGLDHVIAGPLQLVAPLPEVPFVRVVDRAGMVRDVRGGWQRDYEDSLALARELAGRPPP